MAEPPLYSFATGDHDRTAPHHHSRRAVLNSALLFVIETHQVIDETMKVGALTWIENVISGTVSMILDFPLLTPGGLEIGEAGYSHCANELGNDFSVVPSAPFFFAYRAKNALAHLLGAALFLLDRHKVLQYIRVMLAARE